VAGGNDARFDIVIVRKVRGTDGFADRHEYLHALFCFRTLAAGRGKATADTRVEHRFGIG